tara:strand:- start:1 stop:180 length:180 start_codon:yes stop_codon:yes gene_type:complete
MQNYICANCKKEIIFNKKKDSSNDINYGNILDEEKKFWNNYKEGDSYGKWVEERIGSFR